MQVHPFSPIADSNSEVLILGSFPSVRSRDDGFYYAHPANRFWRVIARVTDSAEPVCTDEKKRLLLSHGIALWDVIASCDIVGSSDSSISNVAVNDIAGFLVAHSIRAIYLNGRTAEKFYRRYAVRQTGIDAICLPSTSSANAALSLDALVEKWRIILR